MESLKIVVEKRSDGFDADPLGVRGIVLGQGNSDKKVLAGAAG